MKLDDLEVENKKLYLGYTEPYHTHHEWMDSLISSILDTMHGDEETGYHISLLLNAIKNAVQLDDFVYLNGPVYRHHCKLLGLDSVALLSGFRKFVEIPVLDIKYELGVKPYTRLKRISADQLAVELKAIPEHIIDKASSIVKARVKKVLAGINLKTIAKEEGISSAVVCKSLIKIRKHSITGYRE